ncbi:helix-turn-helix domain-containing protein [Bacillus cereus]|uniref:helix-turn-helix domain-containing protein n=1 Tax=Paenibacillus melissococcoides TaxID=2912268 RepID=UPI0021C31FC3|nr:helix-turn-helix domain-containing protein [Paenibacillus melissococcoides]MEB9897187.1 helix-turn-helix domain-containing protein [Bacillus cereus]CAH8721271.1 helix-turn-helix domain-containing protein [Paenibacillus melissococcoides]
METKKIYLSAEEVAKELNIGIQTVYKLKERQLIPVNQETYRGDGGFRYRVEDVEKIRPLFKRQEGFTLPQAARKLKISSSYLYQFVCSGEIDYEEGEYRGRKGYFFTREALDDFKRLHPEIGGDKDVLFDRKSGRFLYQPWIGPNEEMGRIVRIKRVGGKSKVICTLRVNGNDLNIEEAVLNGWKPTLTIAPARAIPGYGYAEFSFPKPITIDSIVYTLIELLFENAGPYNMQIEETDSKINVKIKKTEIANVHAETHPDVVSKLQLFLTSGRIIEKYNGILIDTNFSTVQLSLENDIKEAIFKRYGTGEPMQEALNRHLRDLFIGRDIIEN